MQNLALGISGAALIALTNVDHTLTTDNQGEAMRFVLILTGTLTANVNVIVPPESRVFVADNRTTGAFTVTVKTAAGGGVAVDQGARTLIYCDGSTVYPVASGTGGGGGSGAPTDATYLVQSPHALLTGERAVTNTPTVVWDFATPGAAGATIPDGGVSYAKVQDVAAKRLMGRYTPSAGPMQEVTLGTGLTLDDAGLLTATAGSAQPADATLTALAGLATGANQLPYFTGTDTAAQTPLTPLARTLLDDADQAAMQATLGVVPGTTVQPLDATLTALAGVTTGADQLPFFTGTDTASTTVLTAFMRSLLDDPDAATARSTLGVSGATAAPLGAEYITSTADAALTAERVLTDTATVTWDFATAGQAKAHATGGATTFLALTDTPDAYSGQESKVVAVKADATGLEFVPAPAPVDAEYITSATHATLTGERVLTNTGTVTWDFSTAGQAKANASASGAPTDAEYITSTAHATLSAERVLTDTATVTWDRSTAGQIKANAAGGGTGVGVEVRRNALQAIVGGVAAALIFDTEVRDDAAFWNSGQPTRLTAATAGWYNITGYIEWQSGANIARNVHLRINGVYQITESSLANIATYSQNISLSWYLNAGDYVDVVASHSGIPDLNVVGRASMLGVTTTPASATNFLALTDTPDTYTGQGGKVVQVNTAETATEFGPVLGTMAEQNADAVAITGGSIALGGAGTGLAQLAVASTFYSSDAAAWIPLRIYPKVETASQTVRAIRIEPVGGAQAAAVTSAIGVQVIDPGTLAANATVYGISTAIVAGTNKYNIYAQGTAPNYFAGRVGIGVVPVSGIQLYVEYDKSVDHGLYLRQLVNDAGARSAIIFANVAGGHVGSISTTATATAYNTSSDVRLKHAIATLTGALDRVRALRPVGFRWNADDSSGVGYLAHELMTVVPEAVTGLPDAVDDKGQIVPQQVDHSKLVPWLCAAVQELAAQVQTLTTRIHTLEEALGV